MNKKKALPYQTIKDLKELEGYGYWSSETSLNIYEMYVSSQLFSTDVKTTIICDKKALPSNYFPLLNIFLALDESLLDVIKEKLWEYCEHCFYAIDYGAEFENQTNYEFFGIHSLNDAYQHTKLDSILIDAEDNYCEILFYPEWEDEHGFTVKIVEGELVFEEIVDDDFFAIRKHKSDLSQLSEADLVSSLKLDSSEVAMTAKDINENTRYYNGDLSKKHIKLLKNIIKNPFLMSGSLDLDSLESAKELTLPQSIGGYLDLGYLGYYEPIEGLILPESIGLDLNMRYVQSSKGLTLPKTIGRSLNLMSLVSAKGLIFPKMLNGSLYLHALETAEGLVLPTHIAGSLNLSALESAKGLVLPDTIGGDLYLGLISAVGLTLKKFIGKGIYLQSLKSAQGLLLPETVNENLILSNLETTDGLILPKSITGILNLSALKFAKDLILPESIGSLWVSSLNIQERERLAQKHPNHREKIFAN